MKSIGIIILMIISICIYWGCSKTATKPNDDENQNDCTPKFPDKKVTYENYVKGIIQTYCTPTCHNGGSLGPGDFRTYQGVLPYADQFQIRVIQDRADMPQGNAPLPKAIRDSISIWVQNCSPKN